MNISNAEAGLGFLLVMLTWLTFTNARSLEKIERSLQNDRNGYNLLSALHSIEEKLESMKQAGWETRCFAKDMRDLVIRHENEISHTLLIAELSTRLGVPLPGQKDGKNGKQQQPV